MHTPQPLRAPEDGCTCRADLLGVGRAQGGRGAQGGYTGADSVSLTGMFIQARRQRHRSTSTRGPTFPQQSQAGVPSVEGWLMMTMSRSSTGSFPKRSTMQRQFRRGKSGLQSSRKPALTSRGHKGRLAIPGGRERAISTAMYMEGLWNPPGH